MKYQALLSFLRREFQTVFYLDKLKIIKFLLVLFAKNREVDIAFRMCLHVSQQ